MHSIKAIRGAITIVKNTELEIIDAMHRLLDAIEQQNPLLIPESIIAVWLTATKDITAIFPTRVFQERGQKWRDVPRMCAQEMDVYQALPFCIRIKILADLADTPNHVYLEKAVALKA